MGGKNVSKILGICVAAILVGFTIWYILLSMGGDLGKLSKTDAENIFKGSKLRTGKDVTGVKFFEYTKKFLSNLDEHAINSACTKDAYEGEDKTKKGELMKSVLEEANKLLFDTDKYQRMAALPNLENAINEDAKAITKDQLDDKEKATIALAKAFIYNVLAIHARAADYKNYLEKYHDTHVGEHLKKLGKEEDASTVDVLCLDSALAGGEKEGVGKGEVMKIHELLYSEIYLTSKLIPDGATEPEKPLAPEPEATPGFWSRWTTEWFGKKG